MSRINPFPQLFLHIFREAAPCGIFDDLPQYFRVDAQIPAVCIGFFLYPVFRDDFHGRTPHQRAHGKTAHVLIFIKVNPGSHLQARPDRDALQFSTRKFRYVLPDRIFNTADISL